MLNLFFISSSADAGVIGRGELKLSGTAVKSFIEYIQLNKGKPRLFLVPIDGSSAFWWYCPHEHGTCVPGGAAQEIRKCEKYHKKDCAVFAKRRTIKWSNGINKGGKESRFRSKMSESEIKAKLANLGFYGGTISTTTKSKKKKSSDDNISQQLNDLNELYKSGALTKEEFKKAKKKLLN